MMEEMPRTWRQATLKEAVDILDNERVPVNNKDRQLRLAGASQRFPYYGATGKVGEIDEFIFDGESVLLGEDGAPFLEAYKPKAYLVKGKYWVNNHAHILRGNGAVDNNFLRYQLNTLDYRNYVSGTTRLKLTKASLKELPIKLPPLNEQHRIVERIETLFTRLDKGEESLREVQKQLARYRQSVLKAAVTGQLTADWRAENAHRLEHGRDLLARILQTRREAWEGRGKYKEPIAPDTSNLPELPEGWAWAKVDQILRSDLNNGRSVPDAVDGFPVLRLTAMKDGVIDLSERKIGQWEAASAQPFLVKQGDVLVSRGNGSKQLVGRGGLVVAEPDPVAFPDTMIRIPLLLKHLFPAWFLQLWNSAFMRAQIEKSAKTTAGIYKINQTDIRNFNVPLPPLAEQGEIAERVEEAVEKIRALERWCTTELARSTALRQSILKEAFAGRLVPQDPNDEPASELLARIRAEQSSRSKKSASPA